MHVTKGIDKLVVEVEEDPDMGDGFAKVDLFVEGIIEKVQDLFGQKFSNICRLKGFTKNSWQNLYQLCSVEGSTNYSGGGTNSNREGTFN